MIRLSIKVVASKKFRVLIINVKVKLASFITIDISTNFRKKDDEIPLL